MTSNIHASMLPRVLDEKKLGPSVSPNQGTYVLDEAVSATWRE
jgi:hypothetical protein